MDSDSDPEVSAAPQKPKDPNLQEGAGVNYSITQGCKRNSILVKFQGYLYRRRGPKICSKYKNVTYLRCRHMTRSENPCRGSAEIRNKVCALKDVLKNPHTCGPPASVIAETEAHELKTVMKSRATVEGTRLKVSFVTVIERASIIEQPVTVLYDSDLSGYACQRFGMLVNAKYTSVLASSVSGFLFTKG